MANTVNLWGETNANLIGDDTSPSFRISNTSTGRALDLDAVGAIALDARAIVAGPAIDVYVSGASGTVLKLNNLGRGYVSTNSTASLSYAARVDIGGVIYYVPVYLGVA